MTSGLTTTPVTGDRAAVGALLRGWRTRRRRSQLELALAAGVSTRHLSFVETGRSQPSRALVLALAEALQVPLRARNDLLLAAGYAPVYSSGNLAAAPMAPVRAALDVLLAAYEPWPAVVVDRGWTMVAANPGVGRLTAGVAPALLEPPVNVLRLALHPQGLAPRIVNLAEWRGHLLDRLAHDAALADDPDLLALHAELAALPGGRAPVSSGAIVVPLRLREGDRELTFISTMTHFGSAVDVTVAELSIETFLPADEATAAAVRASVD
ncbi:MAG: MmyB family transcriptional regulator [Jatrophihabitans sp.]|uniref:MmyB family transcriptional regulator n=1 Tax=Jatrophihabitans sp. TaxID=1932789 RepID=UPI003F7F3AE1